jgi:hypothetical protein
MLGSVVAVIVFFVSLGSLALCFLHLVRFLASCLGKKKGDSHRKPPPTHSEGF